MGAVDAIPRESRTPPAATAAFREADRGHRPRRTPLTWVRNGGLTTLLLLLPTLFVFGASAGARSINLAVSGAARQITGSGVQVLHIIGARNDDVEVPADLAAPYVKVKFLKEMELGYAAGDLALCRGGAMTCAETAAVGMPAIYVPLPWGNGEQRRNALPVVEAGGGLIVEDGDLSPQWVTDTVVPLVRDGARLAAMSRAAAGYGRRDGDEALRRYLLKVVGA